MFFARPGATVLLAALSSGASPPALAAAAPLSDRAHPVWHTVGLWRQPQGLPQNGIRALLQTRDGYLWLGTSAGAARFDGVRFTTLGEGSASSLREREIWALLESTDGSLWIGTYGGGIARLENGRVTLYSAEDGLASDFVAALCQDREGAIWIGTDGGLSRFHDGRFTTYGVADGLSHAKVRALFTDADGSIWIGTIDGGVHRFAGGAIHPVQIDAPRPEYEVRGFCRDREGALWMATFKGLWRLQDGRWTRFGAEDGLASSVVDRVHEDRDGNLWIATDRGLNRYQGGRFVYHRVAYALPHQQHFTALASDREGSLWVGSWSQGLAHLRRSQFLTYASRDGLAGDYVSAVLEDGAGDVWIASNKGVSVIRGGELQTLAFEGAAALNATALAEDRRGTLWIGTTAGVHLLRRAGRGRERRAVLLAGDPKLYARVIYEDRQGVVWIGTDSGGLVRCEGRSLTRYTTQDGLSNDAVRALAEDADGGLWIGTKGGGLNRLSGGRFAVFSRRDGLPSNSVYALYADSAGSLWIATSEGVARLRDGRFASITADDGLYASFVYNFVEDDQRHLWMSCSRGIFRVPKQELEELADGRRRSVHSVAYGVEHGLGGVVGTVGHHPGGYRARDGRIWFATADGAAAVDPRALPVNTVPPPVHIEELEVDREPVDLRRPIELRPGRGDLVFRYTGLSFLAPEKVRFRYKLEGYDPDWNDAGTRRVAYYTNIPPGAYRFRVTACNNDGMWNDVGASLELYLPPQFYRTHWFLGVCALALCVAAVASHRVRVRALAARQARLQRLVDERTHDLQDATRKLDVTNRDLERRVAEGIEALREAERMAAYGQMVAAVAHEVRHPVFALQAAAHVLRERVGPDPRFASQLRTLASETRRLNVLMSDLLEFARPADLHLGPASAADLFAEAADVFGTEGHPDLGVVLEVEPGLPRLHVDRFRVVQALLNLMRNAAGHAGALTRIMLVARRAPDGAAGSVRLSVRDDGEGIPPELLKRVFEPFVTGGKGTGLGLALVRRIAAAHGGEVSVDSEPGRGSAFHLDLPAAEIPEAAAVP